MAYFSWLLQVSSQPGPWGLAFYQAANLDAGGGEDGEEPAISVKSAQSQGRRREGSYERSTGGALRQG